MPFPREFFQTVTLDTLETMMSLEDIEDAAAHSDEAA
jgi:hypothetical protein